tara:strand:+ start:3941 stop:4066 length:126 start_codon:yes stop_codon:yes gene_type:complete
MKKLFFKKKSLWVPAVIVILFISLMIILSKFGVNPLGYSIF